MQDLLDFLNRLERERIAYSLEHSREEAVMVLVAVPGERWEVEFFADAPPEVEVFTTLGVDVGMERIEELFERHGEAPTA